MAIEPECYARARCRRRARPASASSSPHIPAVPGPFEPLVGRVAQPPPSPTMVLHTLAVQSALWHWFELVQAVPVGSLSEHVPSLAQKSPDGQSASLVHPPAVAHVIVV